MNPTEETYKPLTAAYDFLNKELFDSKLPTCLITMQRKGKAKGYFHAESFETRKKQDIKIHEIALNPTYFKDRTDDNIFSTLLHEMVHLWQEENGSAPRINYHNREWSNKMQEFGLMPSNTGQEGGRKTGRSMSHYILQGGKFDALIKKFIENNAILYQDRPVLKITVSKKKNKIKYICQKCLLKAWGKANMKLVCGTDNVELVSAEGGESEK